MSNLVRIASAAEIPLGERKLCEVAGRRIAVFHLADAWIAIDNHCPHRGGPIAAGPLAGNELTCPWHGWRFNLRTGACVHESPAPLTQFPVVLREGDVYIDLAPPVAGASGPAEDGIFRYLVRYGAHGFLGRFGSVHQLDCRRGDFVVVHTDRGLELGELLAAPAAEAPGVTPRPPAGEVVRRATPAEIAQRNAPPARAERVLARARQLATEKQLPVTLVDAEELLDGATLVVYYLGTPSEKLGPLAVGLGQWLGSAQVRFQQLEPQAPGAAAADSLLLPESALMKGPAERLKYDLRRVWECPVCRHKERTGGDASSLLCHCQEQVEPAQRRWMKLVEDGVRRNPDPKPVVIQSPPALAHVEPAPEERSALDSAAEPAPAEAAPAEAAPAEPAAAAPHPTPPATES